MKFNTKSFLPCLFWLFPLLICAILSLLYACDFISTSFFALLSRINGCLFYVLMACLVCTIMKKRQFIIALFISVLFLAVHLMFPHDLAEHLLFAFKLILFNSIVLRNLMQNQSR